MEPLTLEQSFMPDSADRPVPLPFLSPAAAARVESSLRVQLDGAIALLARAMAARDASRARFLAQYADRIRVEIAAHRRVFGTTTEA